MIELQHVTLRRGQNEVLKDISLHIPAGRITAVVGRSGVGKTSLLGALNGLLTPSGGSIAVDGVGRLDCGKALLRHRQRTATIFQNHALIDRLSAFDNVLLGLADQRHPLSLMPWSEKFRYMAAGALERIGLLQRAHARVDCLSGGEKQRVGVARALVRQPHLLLGDEPFASVDPALIRQMGNTLREQVADNGMTVVLVMHQIDTALSIADRIIALVDGRLGFDGESRDFDQAAQAQVFGYVEESSETCMTNPQQAFSS